MVAFMGESQTPECPCISFHLPTRRAPEPGMLHGARPPLEHAVACRSNNASVRALGAPLESISHWFTPSNGVIGLEHVGQGRPRLSDAPMSSLAAPAAKVGNQLHVQVQPSD